MRFSPDDAGVFSRVALVSPVSAPDLASLPQAALDELGAVAAGGFAGFGLRSISQT